MKYHVLLRIKIHQFPQYFVQVATILDISVHPNLNDEITVDDYNCKIERISYDLKDDEGMICLINEDGPHEDEECKVVDRLKYEAKELEPYGWWLNDHDYGEY